MQNFHLYARIYICAKHRRVFLRSCVRRTNLVYKLISGGDVEEEASDAYSLSGLYERAKITTEA